MISRISLLILNKILRKVILKKEGYLAAKKISRISLLILRKILRKVILKKEGYLAAKKIKTSL